MLTNLVLILVIASGDMYVNYELVQICSVQKDFIEEPLSAEAEWEDRLLHQLGGGIHIIMCPQRIQVYMVVDETLRTVEYYENMVPQTVSFSLPDDLELTYQPAPEPTIN